MLQNELDMSFNYEPVFYGEIKECVGDELNTDTVIYQWLLKANEEDKRLEDTLLRLGEKSKFFNERICWEHNIMQTVVECQSLP